MHHLPLHRRHRIEFRRLAAPYDVGSGTHGNRLESEAPALAISRGVDDDLLARITVGSMDDRVDQILDGVDRLAVPADEEPRVGRAARNGDRLVVLLDVEASLDAERRRDLAEQAADLARPP